MSTKEEREMRDLALKVERDFDDLCHAGDLTELDAMSDSLRNTFDKMLKMVCELKREKQEGKA
jgi:hypothetical protein